jgi:hypothetical protein
VASPRRIYSYDKGMPQSYVDVWVDDEADFVQVGIHGAWRAATLEGTKAHVTETLEGVLGALRGHGAQPHPGHGPEIADVAEPIMAEWGECSLCGHPRSESGICTFAKCPDASYNLRAEVADGFLKDMRRLGVRGETLTALEDLMARKFVKRGV